MLQGKKSVRSQHTQENNMVVKEAWPEATGSQGEQDDLDNGSVIDQTLASKKIKINDLEPVYKEEDITGLLIEGTNVYAGEKRHLMNVLDYLL